jgi:hypothetical protein
VTSKLAKTMARMGRILVIIVRLRVPATSSLAVQNRPSWLACPERLLRRSDSAFKSDLLPVDLGKGRDGSHKSLSVSAKPL